MKSLKPSFFLLLCLSSVSLRAQDGLDIYFVDVEGGAATLIVTPQKESILVDTGYPREDARDPKRIYQAAVELAGLQQIDTLITTHFHRDHYGGVLQLSEMIPIRNFLDHGLLTSLQEDDQFAVRYADYKKAHGGRRKTLRPGDRISLKQGRVPLEVLCLASNGETLTGTGAPNPACSELRTEEDDPSDNARSVGFLLRYGDFEFLDLGDLTWNVESKLVCPSNQIGSVDAYQVTHHGLSNSNNEVLVRSVQPTVAIFNNGPRKGGHSRVFQLLDSLSSVEDIFQGHRNLETTAEENTDPDLIANTGSEEGCAGHWIRLSVSPDASRFTVTNGRNKVTRTYSVR